MLNSVGLSGVIVRYMCYKGSKGCSKGQEESRRVKKSQEGSRRGTKVNKGPKVSRRVKKSQEGISPALDMGNSMNIFTF